MPEYGSGGSEAFAQYVKRGTYTITAGQLFVDVAHGLGYAPTGGGAKSTSFNGVDAIIDWAAQLDAGTVTANRIYTLGYNGSSTIIRNQIFVTMTMNFTAIKDLSTIQN